MTTPKTWTDRAAAILLDERNKRYLGMTEPTNPGASKDAPVTAAGRALLERLEDAEWRCVHWDDVAYTLPQRILAIEAEAAADPVVVRIHHGDSDAYVRAYNTGYDDAMEHAAADPSGLRAALLDVERLAEAVEIVGGRSFDLRASRRDVEQVAAEYARLTADAEGRE